MKPDLDTLRLGPVAARAPRCAWPTCSGPTARRSSPRRARSCARQLERLAERGLEAYAGTELEFIVFRDTYEEALATGLPRPRAGQPLQRRLLAARHRARRAADPPDPQRDGARAGMTVENSKGECNLGQHEINFRYGAGAARPPTSTSIYKNGAKEIAAQEGMAITFMAKFDEREGNSCHIHLLAARDGRQRRCSPTTPALFDALPRRPARLPARADAVLRAERQLLQALRRRARSRRPRSPGARDNRTCALRVVGHGDALRVECRAARRRRQPVPRARRR